MNYRAEIDGLRAFAVVPVVLFHAGFTTFSGGFTGVDVFFVISGYLITTLLIDDLDKARFSIARFYERRVRRILPALYLVVLLTLGLAIVLLTPDDLVRLAKSAVSTPIFLSNVFFWSERGYFGPATELTPLIHTWSLAVEEQFYILFPLFLFLTYRRSKTAFLLLIGAFSAVSLAASYYVTRLHFDTAFYLPFTRAWELLIGSIVALAVRRREKIINHPLLAELVGVAGMAMILYSIFRFDQATPFPSITALVPTMGTAFVIVGSREGVALRTVLSFRPFVVIGLMSYSLYLIHQPLFVLARTAGLFESYKYAAIPLSFLLAFASYHGVEKPFRRRGGLRTRTIWGLAAIFSIAIVTLGIFVIKKDGFPGRYNPSDQRILLQYVELPGYNQRLFDALSGASFDQGKKKVLLIGDSHAKDFLNVLDEAGLLSTLSVSTRQVNAECGNLYLDDYSVIAANIPDALKERCKVLGRYDGERFKALADEADEIWLVNAWNPWVVPYLPQSIARIKTEFGAIVRVFGPKDFGVVDKQKVLGIAPNERSTYAQAVSAQAGETERLMDQLLEGVEYYHPVMAAMCGGSREQCRIFDAEGYVVSPDGGHLTREGAKEVGKRLGPLLGEISK